MIRGHVILATTAFLENHPRLSRRWGDDLSTELRTALITVQPSGWYPRRHQVELLKVLAGANPRENGGYAELLNCGASLARMDNQFWKLLLQILTPELFIKKLPRFWTRDHMGGGHFEVESLDVQGGRAKVTLKNVGGYDHAAVLWLGWLKAVLEQLNGQRIVIKQAGWSFEEPGPAAVVYEASWS